MHMPGSVRGLGWCPFPEGSYLARVICQEVPIQTLPQRYETAPPAPETEPKMRPISPSDPDYPGYYTGWTLFDLYETGVQRSEAAREQAQREIAAGAWGGGAGGTLPPQNGESPSWFKWALIGGGALVLVLALSGGRR